MTSQPLQQPSRSALSPEQREDEIDKICSGFVAPGAANRKIYRILLERLLPLGAGIPGPHVNRDELRGAVETHHKPGYRDVFRRMRELQGEEGVTGIIKAGVTYQLVHTAVGAKREPRRPVPKRVARQIALDQGSRCNVCGGPIVIEGATSIDADHRVPRRRGGGSHPSNLQMLCTACNNAKSTQCSNCTLDCNTCGWAFPEQYRPVKLRPDVVLRLNALARERNQDVDRLANELLARGLSQL